MIYPFGLAISDEDPIQWIVKRNGEPWRFCRTKVGLVLAFQSLRERTGKRKRLLTDIEIEGLLESYPERREPIGP